MSSVVTHEKFGVDLDKLKDMGVEVERSGFPTDDELKIGDPEYGDTTLGKLSDDQFALYVDLVRTNEELQNLTKETLSKMFHRAGDTMREAGTFEEFVERMSSEEEGQKFADDADAKRYFTLLSRANMLKHMFYHALAEQFDCFEYAMAVRSDRRFVKRERKY